jgi:endonuclease/exonuclease/phosphatase family metal-dependent hydrolase
MAQGWDAVRHLRAPFAERYKDADVLAQCGSTDVLCIQELFSRDAQVFFDGLGQRHFVSAFRDDNRVRLSNATVRGSGLGIGARLPLTKPRLRSFPGERAGWDRLARKGALYTQLAFAGGLVVDLVTAHLQAGYDEAAVRVRAAQLEDLKTMIAEVGSSERPFLLCGDFNVDGLRASRGEPEYRRLREALEDFEDLGAADDLPTFHPHPEGNALAHAFEPEGRAQRIDYVLWRPGSRSGEVRCKGLARFFDQPLSGAAAGAGVAAWASDHYGLTAKFEIDV